MTKTEKNREEKRRRVVMPAGIRNKMAAAVSMLLVACIMMVSSTYAWFTLSTAPEVRGITTNVGANGNLEMMLLNKASFTSGEDNLGIESDVNQSMAVASITKANATWGNLVDLSPQDYGLQSIVINPARLNIQGDDGAYYLNETLLMAPSYANDGRVVSVDKATMTGGYSDAGWQWNETADNAYGVRVIGTTSGVTARLTAYRAAVQARSAAIEGTKALARKSLTDNGQALADIMVKAAMDESSTFTRSQVESLRAMVLALEEANNKAWEGIVQTVLAYNLSAANTDQLLDDDVANIKDALTGSGTTIGKLADTYTKSDGSSANIMKPDRTTDAIDKWDANKKAIDKSRTEVDGLLSDTTEGKTYTYKEIRTVVDGLVNKQYATVAGVENPNSGNIDQIIGNIVDANLHVSIVMKANSGIYADIAELVGDYTASGITVYVSYKSLLVDKPFDVTMETAVEATANENTIPMIGVMVVGNQPEATPDKNNKPQLTDHFGYALDMGFRTNAAASDLQLQIGEKQRVYNDADETANTADTTQGGGSYMQFTSVNTETFSVTELRALMSAMRVVFVESTVSSTTTDGEPAYTVSYKILGVAAADIAKSTEGNVDTYTGGQVINSTGVILENAADNATGAAGLKADLYLQDYVVNSDKTITVKGKLGTESEDGNKFTPTTTLTALTQNVAKKVTAIVYIDGDIVDNTMVANAVNSMSGKLNLQFTSSATLKPMDNTNMRNGGTTAGSQSTDVTFSDEVPAGATYTHGELKGTVKSGYSIWKGSDGNYYYQYSGGPHVKITAGNITTAVDLQTNSSGENG